MVVGYVRLIYTVFLVLVFTSTTEAGVREKSKKREFRQEARIKKGVESGKLNKNEAKRLVKQQKHIDNYKRKIASDGEITKKEQYKLRKKQDFASKSIYKEKHDKQNQWKSKKARKENKESVGADDSNNQEQQDTQALVVEE